jgi:hypothetical protein
MCPVASKFLHHHTCTQFRTVELGCRCSVRFLCKEWTTGWKFTVRSLVFDIFIKGTYSWTHFWGILIFTADQCMWHFPCRRLNQLRLLTVGWRSLILSSIAAMLNNYYCSLFHCRTSSLKCHSARLTSHKILPRVTVFVCHWIQNIISSNSQPHRR